MAMAMTLATTMAMAMTLAMTMAMAMAMTMGIHSKMALWSWMQDALNHLLFKVIQHLLKSGQRTVGVTQTQILAVLIRHRNRHRNE